MASYNDAASVETVIDDSLAAGGISQTTADQIKELVSQLGAEGATNVAENVKTNITEAAQVTAPVVIMDPTTSAKVTFDANSEVKAMVVGGGGNSEVKFETSEAVTVQLQGGENDSVSTGSGDDAITFAGGTATIDTGEGNDVVVLQGGEKGGVATVQGGTGNMVVNLDFDLGTANVSASIDAGDGFDAVSISQPRGGFLIQFVNGVFNMVKNALSAHDGEGRAAEGSIDMVNVNVVQFTGGDDTIDEISILATNEAQSLVGRLYQVALGREAIDHDGPNYTGGTNLVGLDNWMQAAAKIGNADQAGIDQMAYNLVNCTEFDDQYGTMSAQEFADAMFANLNKMNTGADITTVNNMTAADYAAQIASGQMNKIDVAIDIASSDVAQDLATGSQYVIEGWA